MRLPDDLVPFIESHFSIDDQAKVYAVLAQVSVEGTGQSAARLLRCTLLAARGSLQSLAYYVSLLAVDWRDVIIAGEYELQGSALVRVRDLDEPLQVWQFIQTEADSLLGLIQALGHRRQP